METGIKENILAFNRGITNTPSDLVCDDDCLSVCEGLTNVEGEMKAVQRPVGILDGKELDEIVCIHRGDGYKHYITIDRANVNTSSKAKAANSAIRPRRSQTTDGTTITCNGIGLYYETEETQEASGKNMRVKIFASSAVDYDIVVTLKTKVVSSFEITIKAGTAMSDDYVISDWQDGDEISFVSINKQNSEFEYTWFGTTEPDIYNVDFQVTKTADANKITFTSSALSDDIKLSFLINGVYTVVHTHTAGLTSSEFAPTDYQIKTVSLISYSPSASTASSAVYQVTRLADVTDGTSGDADDDPDNPGSSVSPNDVLSYYDETTNITTDITKQSAYYTVRDVAVLGNMLIVTADEGMFYYLWTTNDDGYQYYKYLGDSVPEPKVEFRLNKKLTVWGDTTPELDSDEDQDTYNNAFVGVYSSAVKECHRKKYFCKPFFARVAVALKDGSYTKATAPVLLFGGVTKNGVIRHDTEENTYDCGVEGVELQYKNSTEYDDWSDLVDGITLFVTDEIELFDNSQDVDKTSSTSAFSDMICVSTQSSVYYSKYIQQLHSDSSGKYKFFGGLAKRELADVIKDISEARVYYKLGDIGKELSTAWSDASAIMNKYTLENITTQDQLTSGDYFSHCKLIPEGIKMLNRRCNIWGVKRGFFDGFSQFLPYSYDTNVTPEAHTYLYKVYIRTSSGVKTVSKTVSTKDTFYDGAWFYYPDPRAYKLQVYKITPATESTESTTSIVADVEMKEHCGLNGAYCFSALPVNDSLNPRPETSSTKAIDISTGAPAEALSNYVLQSEVDMPMVFNASGYVRVGQGEILGLAGLTTALSQDAYKVATTICFTTQGIWAIAIDSTGVYAQISPAFSREVCVNPECITMTDDAVFFVSKKGLMCVTGTNEASVVCVSEQIENNDLFRGLILEDGCRIAYDYLAGLVFVLTPDDYNNFVFNIKSKTWSTMSCLFDRTDYSCFSTCVNDYPDTLLQDSTGKVYSFYEKPIRSEDTRLYDGIFESRALKLDGSTVLKSLRQVKVLDCIDKTRTTKFTISGTNSLTKTSPWTAPAWTTLNSRRGKSWRFFKVHLKYEGISADEAFSGMILVTQERFTNKIR